MKGLMIGFAWVILFGFSSYSDAHYCINAEVVAVEQDEIVAVDATGQEWVFFGDEVKVNDTIKLTFENNHTLDRQDDKVVNFKVV